MIHPVWEAFWLNFLFGLLYLSFHQFRLFFSSISSFVSSISITCIDFLILSSCLFMFSWDIFISSLSYLNMLIIVHSKWVSEVLSRSFLLGVITMRLAIFGRELSWLFFFPFSGSSCVCSLTTDGKAELGPEHRHAL